jgi:rubrerythrin
MEISREQIIDLAKITAQIVLDKMHRAPLVYQTPASIAEGLQHSMSEELTAANWYRERAKHAISLGDHATAEVYEDIARDEDDHYRQFNQRLNKVPGQE